jgi:prostatic aicd phosphatase
MKMSKRTFPKRIFLYSGHDSTIVNILSALNVWEENIQYPDFAITILIELSKHKITKQYGIEVCYI